MSYKKNKDTQDIKVMPRLFFDMPKNCGMVLLVLNKKNKIVTEWWSRDVDEAGAKEMFERWSARGHAAFMTLNGVVIDRTMNEPIMSVKHEVEE